MPRRARTWTGLVAACALVAASAGCRSREIVTERLVITDAQGTPRIFLGVTEEGEAGLLLVDAKGGVRAAVTLIGERAEVSVGGANGRPLVVCTARGDEAAFALRDKDGAVRARLTTGEGEPRLELLDAAGAVVHRAP